MEEPKEIKVTLGTVICIFIILVLIIALAGMYFYYNNKLDSNKEIYKNTESNNIAEKQYLENVNNNQEDEDYETTGKRLFEQYLQRQKELVDYKINSCKMVSCYDNEFVCEMNYDVKVEGNAEDSVWTAGNGKAEGNWIKGKNVFLSFKEINGVYTYNEDAGQMTAWDASEKTIDNTIGTNDDVNITYIKKLGKNGTLTLPQINEDTEGAKSINEKINKIYNLDEIKGVSNTRVCTELIEYKNKNLMGIALNLEDGADNGINYYFYYDLDTKKEFTLKDIIENEGFSVSDINNKYQETLNSLAETWQEEIKGRKYTITGDEMFYTYNESSEEVGHYVNTLNIVIPIDKAYCRMNNKIYSVTVQYKYLDGYFQF